jgi:hypothetical protein
MSSQTDASSPISKTASARPWSFLRKTSRNHNEVVDGQDSKLELWFLDDHDLKKSAKQSLHPLPNLRFNAAFERYPEPRQICSNLNLRRIHRPNQVSELLVFRGRCFAFPGSNGQVLHRFGRREFPEFHRMMLFSRLNQDTFQFLEIKRLG